jgi:glycosyltransferase involved in cell wall biosynthesis
LKKISILLPVYNSEKTIEQCISSVLSSSHNNFELVVVNDGSNDSSKELIYSIKDHRIKYFEKSNSGLVDTLNFGIKKCSSEILMRIDSDDYIKSEKIELQLKEMQSFNSVLIGTNAYIVDKNDKTIGKTNLPLEHSEIIKSMLKIRPSLIHPSIMVYKEVLHKVNYFDEKYSHAEDYDLFFRISRIGNIKNIPEKLMYLRKTENNISHKNVKEQIVNSFISRENFRTSESFLKTKNENFQAMSKKIKNNYFKLFYIKIHIKIVDLEFNQHQNNLYVKLIMLKTLRRALNLFL